MKQFKKIYWGSDASTEVRFEATREFPPLDSVTACMVAAMHDGKLAMSKPARGWGLVGGHLEKGETTEECIRREAMEEAAIELGELELVGYWKTKKVFESPLNAAYPQVGYQLLYTTKVTRVHDFIPQLEVEERAFIPFAEILRYHHASSDFQEVYEYLVGKLDRETMPVHEQQ